MQRQVGVALARTQRSPQGPRTKAFHERREARPVVAGVAVGCAFSHRSAQAPGGGELAAGRMCKLVRCLDEALRQILIKSPVATLKMPAGSRVTVLGKRRELGSEGCEHLTRGVLIAQGEVHEVVYRLH